MRTFKVSVVVAILALVFAGVGTAQAWGYGPQGPYAPYNSQVPPQGPYGYQYGSPYPETSFNNCGFRGWGCLPTAPPLQAYGYEVHPPNQTLGNLQYGPQCGNSGCYGYDPYDYGAYYGGASGGGPSGGSGW